MNKKVSVIVPVFNNQKFIAKCLTDICGNTYKNLEIVVIDDGSSDDSGKICDDFALKDKRIRVVHQTNSGVSKSRNRGIEIATGTYIAFIDSDDYICDTYFEKLLAEMNDNECDLAVCSVAHVYGKKVVCESLEDMEVNLMYPTDRDSAGFYDLNKSFFLYGPVNKLYKRNLIVSEKIKFPEDTSYGEDLLFNFAYLRHCKKLVYRKQPVYYYNHDNESSLSHRYREDLFENGIRLNSAIRDFCIEKKILIKDLQLYLSERVFDDAYNSLFDVWSNSCDLKIGEKIKRTHMIMNHMEVREANKVIEHRGYSKLYVQLIVYRHTLLFSAIRFFSWLKR